jgi:hypothetical protein
LLAKMLWENYNYKHANVSYGIIEILK